jgi:hypothetical protein
MEKATHPTEAFWFKAGIGLQAKEEGKPRQFSGTAYTGNALSHRYWGQIVIDLASTTANEKVPALIEHDRGQRVGYCGLAIGQSIEVIGGILLDNEHGQAVAQESDAGFPWQMSVHVEPGSVEDLRPGMTAVINGNDVKGPAAIFRNSVVREVSFTPTGVDNGTSATAFSATYQPTPKREASDMDPKEMEAKLSALEADLKAANARADTAETKLAEQAKSARLSAVKEMFSATGREYTEAAAKPYMAMDDEMFSAVAADLKASKPAEPSDHLFSAHTQDGGSGEGAATETKKPANYLSADFQKSLWRK